MSEQTALTVIDEFTDSRDNMIDPVAMATALLATREALALAAQRAAAAEGRSAILLSAVREIDEQLSWTRSKVEASEPEDKHPDFAYHIGWLTARISQESARAGKAEDECDALRKALRHLGARETIAAARAFFEYGATRGNHPDAGGRGNGPLSPHVEKMGELMTKLAAIDAVMAVQP